MKKTVAVISDSGRLSDALGTNRESDSRYLKFAKRLLGESGTAAVLDYGWNGKTKLVLNAGGSKGSLITLDADEVSATGDILVGGIPLQTLIDTSVDLGITGIKGTAHQVDVTISRTEESSSDSSENPRLTCTISLSSEFVSRITTLEETVEDLIKFEEVYKVGDGLTVVREEDNRLSVKLGTGLKFEEPGESQSEEETAAVTLDMDSTPTQGSVKPVTSGGVYDAIQAGGGGGGRSPYTVGIDPATGNMWLFHNTYDSGSESSSSDEIEYLDEQE